MSKLTSCYRTAKEQHHRFKDELREVTDSILMNHLRYKSGGGGVNSKVCVAEVIKNGLWSDEIIIDRQS